MADGRVFVIDRVLTRPGCTRKFVGAYLAEYAPGAVTRGMTLCDVLVSCPIWYEDQSNIVTITWTLPSNHAWWEMTWKGRPDSALGEWWSRDKRTGRGAVPVGRGGRRRRRRALRCIASPDSSTSPTNIGTACWLLCVRGRKRPTAHHQLIEPTLPRYSATGGDVLVHLRFNSKNEWFSAATDFATVLSGPRDHANQRSRLPGQPARPAARARAPSTALCCCECCPRRMPPPSHASKTSCPRCRATYGPSRHGSSVASTTRSGTSPWTHVFEQEFGDVDGLIGASLHAPDPLGGGGPLVRSGMPRCHHPGSGVPQLLSNRRIGAEVTGGRREVIAPSAGSRQVVACRGGNARTTI